MREGSRNRGIGVISIPPRNGARREIDELISALAEETQGEKRRRRLSRGIDRDSERRQKVGGLPWGSRQFRVASASRAWAATPQLGNRSDSSKTA